MSVVTTYAEALTANAPAITDLLSPACRFVSPFSTWSTATDVAAVYQARAKAIHSLRVERIVAGPDGGGAILWSGEVAGEQVQGCELVTCHDGLVEQVDLFLRPAAVLPQVLEAMRANWPSP